MTKPYEPVELLDLGTADEVILGGDQFPPDNPGGSPNQDVELYEGEQDE